MNGTAGKSFPPMTEDREKQLLRLQEKIVYRFRSPALLEQSLRHRSYAHENPRAGGQDNERLEFLGDAVLDLVIGHLIMDRHPDSPEGTLSRLRAAMVNEIHLAQIARDLGLSEYLLLGKGEEQTGGRGKSSILAAALEALLGAVYLDGGFSEVFRVIAKQFSPRLHLPHGEGVFRDFKSELQEYSQVALKATPRYVLVKEFGPDHNKVFGVKLLIMGKVAGIGAGRSKKEAEQRAAGRTLLRLQAPGKKRNG